MAASHARNAEMRPVFLLPLYRGLCLRARVAYMYAYARGHNHELCENELIVTPRGM